MESNENAVAHAPNLQQEMLEGNGIIPNKHSSC